MPKEAWEKMVEIEAEWSQVECWKQVMEISAERGSGKNGGNSVSTLYHPLTPVHCIRRPPGVSSD